MLTEHSCLDYDLLGAYVHNTNKPLQNKLTVPYKKMWDSLSVADNGFIMLNAPRIIVPKGIHKQAKQG